MSIEAPKYSVKTVIEHPSGLLETEETEGFKPLPFQPGEKPAMPDERTEAIRDTFVEALIAQGAPMYLITYSRQWHEGEGVRLEGVPVRFGRHGFVYQIEEPVGDELRVVVKKLGIYKEIERKDDERTLLVVLYPRDNS